MITYRLAGGILVNKMDIRFLIIAIIGIGLGLLSSFVGRMWFAPLEAAGRYLLDRAADGLIFLDRRGRVLHINASAARLLNVDPRQAIRRHWSFLFAEQPRITSGQLNAANFDTPLAGEQTVELINKDGHRHVTLRADTIYARQQWKLGSLLQLADITAARHREERLETALQEQQALTRALVEASSPVLPVMRQTILMPLVGNLDQNRMAITADALLNGIKTHRARLAILDLTGVSDLSLEAADALRQAIDAMRLLGAEPVLVGIQSHVAEILGSSDLGLGDLVIHSDLRTALEYAAQSRR